MDEKFQVEYQGTFFDQEEIEKLIRKVREIEGMKAEENPFLFRAIKHPHITWEFFGRKNQPTREQLFAPEMYGVEHEYLIIGYANDGENQGVLISLEHLPKEIVENYYKGSEQIHITLSVSKDSKPVKTGDMQFEKIEPFSIKGKLKFYSFDDEIVLSYPEK